MINTIFTKGTRKCNLKKLILQPLSNSGNTEY